MTPVKLSMLATAASAALVGATPAQTGSSVAQTGAPDETAGAHSEIIVTVSPYSDIVVNGRARRCSEASGDPLDSVQVVGALNEHMMIVPDGEGKFVATRVTERITGPEFWQRVGIGMGAYRFRAPGAGKPMCIGGRGSANHFAGFRRIVDATTYRGHRLRFTAWVASRSAGQVSFWLAAGSSRLVDGDPLLTEDRFLNGGNTNNVPFGGNHGWTPVLLETGPVHEDAGHISYGFNLQGSGDVWVHEPKLEIVVDPPGSMRREDLIVIGRRDG